MLLLSQSVFFIENEGVSLCVTMKERARVFAATVWCITFWYSFCHYKVQFLWCTFQAHFGMGTSHFQKVVIRMKLFVFLDVDAMETSMDAMETSMENLKEKSSGSKKCGKNKKSQIFFFLWLLPWVTSLKVTSSKKRGNVTKQTQRLMPPGNFCILLQNNLQIP